MAEHSDDLVKVASGSFMQVQEWGNVLQDAGIKASVVGDDLTASFGTALPGSVELWVHRSDAEAAERALTSAGTDGQHKHHHTPDHNHPVSGSKPDHSRGPTHGAPPHRPVS